MANKTPTDHMIDALHAKGYNSLSRNYVKQEGSQILAFTLYTNGQTVLCLQEWKDGGCELYAPLSDKLGIQDTVERIP